MKQNKQIQTEIMQLLNKNSKCLFGDLVKDLDYTYDEILNNIMELKQQGKIKKIQDHQGSFTLVN